MLRFILVTAVTLILAGNSSVRAQDPQWIWDEVGAPNEASGARTVLFRRSFRTPPYTWNARLTATADDEAEFFLNGQPVARSAAWDAPVRAEVSVNLNQGDNVLAVRVRNLSGPAGLLVHLNLGGERGGIVVSDTNWLTASREQPGWNELAFAAADWKPAIALGPHGMPPWGDVLARPSATPAESIQVPAGYRVELLRSARPDEGSWICTAFDARGRLLVSAENPEVPLLRISFDASRRLERVERVAAPVGQAMGLLDVNGSLYVSGRGPKGTGLYQLQDVDGDDRFDAAETRLLKAFSVGGEHGHHALALGPDGKLYVLNGNMTKPPEGISPHSPLRHQGEDVLSLNPDELGRVTGIPPPAGYIARTDLEGRHWELIVGGLRNAYGFDFNADGELFTFDSDNEWNWGTPWYVPTRVLHAVSGADYGWRDGRRIWPEYLPDSLPPVVNVGIGSPCGVKAGTRSSFPPRMKRALFVQDWSYGRIMAVHLVPEGASYRGSVEPFLRGRPLNLTAMDFGPDGALYFVTGGRGTQSGLYRVSHEGTASGVAQSAAPEATDTPAPQARALRHRLEALHGRIDPKAVELAWEYLGHPDPFLRHAARVALESQPAEGWRARAFSETKSLTSLAALLALARVGEEPDAPGFWRAWSRYELRTLPDDAKLLKIRAAQLALVRWGRPRPTIAAQLRAELEPAYPTGSRNLDPELARILIFLEAPSAIPKTLELMAGLPLIEDQLFYAAQLRNLRRGWTLETRRRLLAWWQRPRSAGQHPAELLAWFAEVDRVYVDGALVDRHLTELHAETVSALTEDERRSLAEVLERPISRGQSLPATPRSFVKQWTTTEILPQLETSAVGRDLKRGRQAFLDLQCLACHRLGNEGGAAGPELNALSSKYTQRDILQSLLEPSKVVSEQYQNLTVELKDGDTVTGRLVQQTAGEVVLETDWRTGAQTRLPAESVLSTRPSQLSPMPEGLLDVLTLDEILDLLAFLVSGTGSP